MKRKFLALIIAMAVVMSLVPMVPITAAVKGTATITGNKVEFADFGPIEGVARLGFFVRIEAVDGSIAGSVNVTLPESTPNITRTIANNNSANLQLNAGTHQNLSVDLGGEFTLGEFLSIEFTSGNLYLRGVEFYDKDNNLIKAKLTGNYIKRLGDWDVEAYRLTNDRMLMDYYGDGTFSANWTLTSGGFGNVLARTGRKFGGATQVRNSGKPHTEHGEIYINYEATQEYNNTRSLIGVYGWTISPAPSPLALIEYYIFDSWDAYKKGPASGGASFKGEYTIPEEGTYVLYENIMNNAPDVMGGNSTFPQLFSIRKDDKRVKGKISVTEHFNAWEKLGYDLGGNLYEVSMLVETMTGNGRTSSASIDKLALSIGGAYVGGEEPGNGGEDPPKEPTALNINFDNGQLGGFLGRGNANVAISTEQARSQPNSLLTTGRTLNWHGPGVQIENMLVAGVEYDISAWVRLKSPTSAVFKITAEIGRDGTRRWEELNERTVTDSGWTQLKGRYSFTAADIASGHIQIYVESLDVSAEFYIDDFSVTPLSSDGFIDIPQSGITGDAGATAKILIGGGIYIDGELIKDISPDNLKLSVNKVDKSSIEVGAFFEALKVYLSGK